MSKPGDQWSAAFAGASVDAMRVYDDLIATLFAPWAQDIVRRVDPAAGASALDIACGPGTVSRVLADRIGVSGRVVATDISPAMLEIAQAKPGPAGAAPIEWVVSPAAPLDVPDDSFDVVTCQQGLQFFPDKSAALSEMRRALRDGGRAVVTFWAAVEDQPLFAIVRDAVEAVMGSTIAARYMGPWALPGEDGLKHAHEAGFDEVRLERITLPVELPGGAEALVISLVASGIAADYAAGGDATHRALVDFTRDRLGSHADDERLASTMTTSMLTLH